MVPLAEGVLSNIQKSVSHLCCGVREILRWKGITEAAIEIFQLGIICLKVLIII